MKRHKIILVIIFIVTAKAEAQTSALRVADSLFANGNYTQAVVQYKAFDSVAKANKIAKAYVSVGHYGEALRFYKLFIETHPNERLTQYEYAKLLLKTKKLNSAKQAFKNLIVSDSLHPDYHYQLGLVLEQQKDSLALQEFETAFSLDSTHQNAVYKVALSKLKKRQFDKAEKLIDIGLQSYAENRKLINLKAQNYFLKDDLHKAISWFEKLLKMGESTAFVYEKLRDCYSLTYRYEKALAYAEKALELDHKNSGNIFKLGEIHFIMKDYAKAETYYKAFLKEEDTPLDAVFIKLSNALNRQEKYLESIKALKRAKQENPENTMVDFYLLNTKTAYYKDHDAKIKLHEDFIKNHPKSPFVSYAQKALEKLKGEQFMGE